LTSCTHTLEIEVPEFGVLPGYGVDGVKLGDSQAEVHAKLGRSNSGFIADGLYRSWFGEDYTEGPHKGVSVYYAERGIKAGPVDLLIVHSEYQYKTIRGVGLGATVQQVRQIYGSPRITSSRSGGIPSMDIFCVNGRSFEIHYKKGVVTSMAIGYFFPMPVECGCDPCK